MRAEVNLKCLTEKGIITIKEALKKATTMNRELEIYLIKSPTYSFQLQNTDQLKLKEILDGILKTVEIAMVENGGSFELINLPRIIGLIK